MNRSIIQQQELEKNIRIFFSKQQLRTIRSIEGNKFIPRYVIINGQKLQYTEVIEGDRRSNFGDASLLYSGKKGNVTFQ